MRVIIAVTMVGLCAAPLAAQTREEVALGLALSLAVTRVLRNLRR